jgi:regulator of cell morphogenesis and NO signaling
MPHGFSRNSGLIIVAAGAVHSPKPAPLPVWTWRPSSACSKRLPEAPEQHGAALHVQTASLTALMTYIVERHHNFTRQEMERLSALLEKVCSVHGGHHPELLEVKRLFQELCHELTPHMCKEEQILFPYIKAMEAAAPPQRALSPPPFGTVRQPVRMMSLEHEKAGDILQRLRAATAEYTVPADGCISYQTLYQALAAFETDLHQHIHLENNILFPRAVKMEDASKAR